ncbi:MAG TPA: thioredoxin family protein [Acidimicrobiia bacterium]|nr:thioredoxin family protein [Acidimicrobiia bacterium]
MAANSTMLPLGTKAPGFDLPDVVSGTEVSLSDFDTKKALVVMFICNHCPYVQHVRDELARFGMDYLNTDLGIVAICANDPDRYPEDGPEAMKKEATTYGYAFPYLFDEDQSVAAAYTAMCTPDFFLFDSNRALVYRGRFDETRPNMGVPATGADLRAAANAVLAGQPVSEQQWPSVGCSIKWKPGNIPAYVGAA